MTAGTWVLAAATILLAGIATCQAIQSRLSLKRILALQALVGLQDTTNLAVREWARAKLAERVTDVGIPLPPGNWFRADSTETVPRGQSKPS